MFYKRETVLLIYYVRGIYMFNQFKRTALICSLVLTSSAFAKLPKGVEKITSVEGITEYQFDNGLQVLMFPDISQETITVNITYHVGSKHEKLWRNRYGSLA